MDSNDSQLVIRDTPVALWMVGLVFGGIGTFLFIQSRARVPFLLIFVAIGLIFLLFSSTLTVTADRMTRTLSLEYRSLLRHSIKQIPFGEIANIHVKRSVSHNKGTTSYTYRVTITQKDGQIVPLRSYYSSGSRGKEQQAEQLRAFIGMQGFDATPMGLLKAVPQMAQAAFQSQQQALTGPENEIHETNGVHWQIQSVAMGATPVTRWTSTDFRTPGTFLFLAQKADGQGSGGGLLASITEMLFKQSIALYGFRADDTPGLEQAKAFAPLDASLEPHFMAYTNDPTAARQTLNPWAVMPLADWARRHPLKQFQAVAGFSQLVLLAGPNGVYLATLGLPQPAQLDELSALGVEFVKSQGASPTAPTTAAW